MREFDTGWLIRFNHVNGCAFLFSSSSYLSISLFMTAGITFEVTDITP